MSAQARWTMPQGVVDRLGEAWPRVEAAIERGVEAASIHLVSKLKTDYLSGQIVNRRSGNLTRSIFWEKTGPLSVRVATGREAPYAYGLNYGTAPHVIEPRNKKALRFEVNGEVVFARIVHHPGNRAFQFMEKALADQRGAMIDLVVNHAMKAMGAA